MARRIRIVNTTGNSNGTKVLDAETGADLTQELQITAVHIEVGELVTAQVTCYVAEVDVVAEVEETDRRCCTCKHSELDVNAQPCRDCDNHNHLWEKE
jgi:hypothetical protein